MKTFVKILIVLFAGGLAFALTDEIGDPTIPPSSVRPGLIQSASPVDDTGNLIVTGNVSGGRHFRGSVPYRGRTEFGDTLGSRDIRSFLRSTAPTGYSRSQLSAQPYYLPSSTVGLTTRGSIDRTYSYPSIKSSYSVGENLPKLKAAKTSFTSALYDYSRTRLLDYSEGDIERTLSYDLIKAQNKERLTTALSKINRPDVQDLTDKSIKQSLPDEQAQRQPDQDSELITRPIRPAEAVSAEPTVETGMRKRIAEPELKVEKYGSVYERMVAEAAGEIAKRDVLAAAEDDGKDKKRIESLKSELSEISEETAESVVGVYKSFAADANDKFNAYMRTAEAYLAAGKYYRAADAYTLAGIYKPGDPLAFAGRAHSLFASGEYMSAAYFLTRAIDIFGEYVNFKIDLKAMIPDAEKLDARIEDLDSWIDKTGSAELSFLLAYIYHQLDKPDLALGAINFTTEKMPDSEAAKTLKSAIKGRESN